MIRAFCWMLATYHTLCIRALLSERRWHMQHGVANDHPHVLGLDYCLAHHDRAIASLGYLGSYNAPQLGATTPATQVANPSHTGTTT